MFGPNARNCLGRMLNWQWGIVGLVALQACGISDQPAKSSDLQSESTLVQLPTEFELDMAPTPRGLHLLKGTAKGKELNVLLDTGVPTFFVSSDIQSIFADHFEGQSIVRGANGVELPVTNIREVNLSFGSRNGSIAVVADYGLGGAFESSRSPGIDLLLNPRFLAVGGWAELDFSLSRISLGRDMLTYKCRGEHTPGAEYFRVMTDWNYRFSSSLKSGGAVSVLFDTGSEVSILFDPDAKLQDSGSASSRTARTVFGDLSLTEVRQLSVSIDEDTQMTFDSYVSNERALPGVDLIVGMDVMNDAKLLICDGQFPVLLVRKVARHRAGNPQ